MSPGSILRSKVTVVPSNFPVEEDILHLWSFSNVVNDHEGSTRPLPIYDDRNVRNAATEIIGDKVARLIVLPTIRNWKRLSFFREKDHQIRHATMINIRVGVPQFPFPLARVGREIILHVLVYFLL